MKLILSIMLLSFSSVAGLPPTSSKVSGESNFPTTFKTDYGSFTGTRSGTTLTITGIGAASGSSLTLSTPLGAASGGTGRSTLTANSLLVGNGTGTVNFIAPSSDGYVLTSIAGVWVAQPPTTGVEPIFSAAIGIDGTVSNEKGPADFITGNCTDANPSVCTLNSFSFVPNCTGTAQSGADRWIHVDNASNTSITVYQKDGDNAAARTAFRLICHGE